MDSPAPAWLRRKRDWRIGAPPPKRRHARSSSWFPPGFLFGNDDTSPDQAKVSNAVAVRKSPATFCSPRRRGKPRLLAARLAREHLVDHRAGEAEIAGRVAHLGELGARKMLGDLRVLRQQLEERLAGGGNLAADVVDEVMGALASEMRTEPHHHGLRDDHAAGEIEIGAHALGIHLDPFDQ